MAKLPLLLVLVVTIATGWIIWQQQRELADLERWKEATLQELKRSPTASVLAVNGAAGVQTDCPPPPPPCPAPSGGGGSGSDLPPPATAGKNEDWRVPPGPIPPRPEKMPNWFKFQQPEQWCVPGPHNKVHSNRVAAIIVNYNMVERADNIAEGIKKHVKWPVDVIVVDNGSDLKDSPPSKHTAIRLEANVQTTNGWLMGVEYAKALSHAYGYCYMAYWIWITTSEYVETKDILTPMAEAMIADPKIAGVSPYLTSDSLPKTWPQLYKQKGTSNTDIKDVNFLDNLATLWRAEWFDSIGVFDPDELRGFGVDTENSYLARLSGRRVVVHQGVSIRKTSGVAYKMKRMNANAAKRGDVATKEMRNCLGFRYGGGKFEGGYTTWSNMPHNKLPPDNDFNKNPRAFFTNRRGAWFDDYTKYRQYQDIPDKIPLFQFPLPSSTKLKAAGTDGLASHGLKRQLLADANHYRNVTAGGTEVEPGQPGAIYVLDGSSSSAEEGESRGDDGVGAGESETLVDEYEDYYAWQAAVLAEANHTALEEEYLAMSQHDLLRGGPDPCSNDAPE